MKWSIGYVGLLAGLCGVGGVAPAAEPVQGQLVKNVRPNQLLIGLPKTLLRGVPDGALRLANKPFQSLILDQTGMPGSILNPNDVMDMARQLDDREIQLGVFHGFEFAWAQTRYPSLAPLVVAVPQVRDIQVYVVVSSKSKFNSLADLKGQTVGIPAESKDHVLVFGDRLMETEWGGRKGVQTCKCVSAKESLFEVVDGTIQATLVDSASFISFAAESPGAARKLKILQKSEVFPPAVIAYRKDSLDAETLKRCRDGLNNASRNSKATFMLSLIKLDGFEAAPGDYETQLKKSLDLYPHSAIERISFEKLLQR